MSEAGHGPQVWQSTPGAADRLARWRREEGRHGIATDTRRRRARHPRNPGRRVRTARRAWPRGRELPHRAARAGRLERLPPRHHESCCAAAGTRAAAKTSPTRPRTTTTYPRSCRWRGSGPSTASRSISAAWTCSPAGRRSSPSVTTGAGPSRAPRSTWPCASGARSWARRSARPYRPVRFVVSHAPRHHALAGRRPGARVQARPDAGVGRGDDAATSPPPAACASSTSSRSTRARRSTTRRTRCSTGASSRRSPTPCSRTRRCGAPRATRCDGEGGALQLRRADPLVGGRRGVAARPAAVDRSRCATSTSSRRASAALRALLDCVERAQAAGMVLYGGGQFELGVGRDQIQALASLLYPDGPNDVAPRDYHGDAARRRAAEPAACRWSRRRASGSRSGVGGAAARRAGPRGSAEVQRPAAPDARRYRDRRLVQHLEDHGRAARARRAQHRARVDDPSPRGRCGSPASAGPRLSCRWTCASSACGSRRKS